MKTSLLLLLFCHVSSPKIHSMNLYFMLPYGVPNSPEYMVIANVEEVIVSYYDSSMNKHEPRQAWIRKFVEENRQFWESGTQESVDYHQVFKAETDSLRQRLNQSGDFEIIQQNIGCDWDDETGKKNAYNHYAYNGKDVIEFDMETQTWAATNTRAQITKQNWDGNEKISVRWKNFLTNDCPVWLQTYLNYGKDFLQTTVPPSVSLLQKSPSSPVSCHATGFFPDRAMMFWRKDKEEIHEGIVPGENLPNHDGTFQMSVDLNITSVTPEDWSRYDCVFRLSGMKDIVTKLDKAVIRTNGVSPSEFPAGAVIGVAAGLLLLLTLLTIAGLFIWRRNNNGFRPANTSDASPSFISIDNNSASN